MITKKNNRFCSPSKRRKFSCFSKKSLIKLTKAYNKHNNENLNLSLSTDLLWQNLNKHLKQICENDLCWLDQDFVKQNLNNNDFLDEFRPQKPKEWYQNPNAWLSTLDIDNVMNQYQQKFKKFKYLGTVPMDFDKKSFTGSCVVSDICKFNLENEYKNGFNKFGVVFNLDKSHQSGSHWVCMFVDLKLEKIYYWDSYGMAPSKEVLDLGKKIEKQALKLNKKMKLYINNYRHQFGNSECGIYCLWFLIRLLESKNSFKTYNQIIKKKVKDSIMQKNRDVLFVS